MQKFAVLLLLIFTAGFLRAQNEALAGEDATPGGIPREEAPLAVIWGFSMYSGMTIPYSPEVFSQFWKPGLNFTVDLDILLRNDIVLGLSFSYSKLKFNSREFWRQRGVEDDDDLGYDFDIPITNLLLSYRGIENYLLYNMETAYEVGGGLYYLKNSQVKIFYIDPYGGYEISRSDDVDFGLFGGLGVAWLITDTLQLSLRGRYHYIFKPSQQHQIFDVRIGFSLL